MTVADRNAARVAVGGLDRLLGEEVELAVGSPVTRKPLFGTVGRLFHHDPAPKALRQAYGPAPLRVYGVGAQPTGADDAYESVTWVAIPHERVRRARVGAADDSPLAVFVDLGDLTMRVRALPLEDGQEAA